MDCLIKKLQFCALIAPAERKKKKKNFEEFWSQTQNEMNQMQTAWGKIETYI